jgi:hypothetical protein
MRSQFREWIVSDGNAFGQNPLWLPSHHQFGGSIPRVPTNHTTTGHQTVVLVRFWPNRTKMFEIEADAPPPPVAPSDRFENRSNTSISCFARSGLLFSCIGFGLGKPFSSTGGNQRVRLDLLG